MVATLLDELADPKSSQALLETLKTLKNDVVGHHQRKELWIRSGVVPCLKRILDTHKFSSKQRRRDERDDDVRKVRHADDQEEARLQTVTIIGSLAHGGPAFVRPMRLAGVWQPLLQLLSPTESRPAMVLAVLRCLNAVADAVALEDIDEHTESEEFLKALYTNQPLGYLNQILKQESSNSIVQQQIVLTTEVIAKTSNTEKRRKQIRISGIFSSMAHLLATFVVASHPLDMALGSANRSGIAAASPRARLAPLLYAICSTIADSKTRANEFCCNAVWGNVFPNYDRDAYSWRVPTSRPARLENVSSLGILSGQPGIFQSREKHNHPQATSFSSPGKPMQRKAYTEGEFEGIEGFNSRNEDDTPLVGWLIDLIRVKDDSVRLMAIWLVGLLFRSQMLSKLRQRSLSMLLVPILVNMLDYVPKTPHRDDAFSASPASFSAPLAQTETRLIREISPRVLALFVQDSVSLQKGAVEGGVIKKLSRLLKQSFDSISPAFITPMWAAHDGRENGLDVNHSPTNLLGPEGIPPLLHHLLQVRESLLAAISAMATLNVAHRQAIIDEGVVAFVIESLKPREMEEMERGSMDNTKPANPVTTLVAACMATMTLSRSVAALRTSLVDAGLAKPIYTLLQHPSPIVRVAATEAICNMVLPFSAMRQDIADAGILHVLCGHAHSPDVKLRISALWALSNFVVEAPNEMKVKVVRELDPAWIKHVISNSGDNPGSRQPYNGAGFPATAANSTGEQVDILNSFDDRSHEYQLHKEAGTEMDLSDSTEALGTLNNASKQASDTLITNSDEYLDADADERTANIQAVRDELALQEQGLNLLRNLLVGGPDISEIVDFLFDELGQDDLFKIFTNLLKPKDLDEFRGQDRRADGPVSKLIPPPTEIVIGVCNILVHIAGSVPRHREVVLAQTELLKHILPLFSHPHSGVRIALVWLVINVCWKEDAGDRDGAITRALELKKLGILTKIHAAASDSDFDVRERAKQVISSLTDLMRE